MALVPSHERTLEMMQLFAEEVMPHFREDANVDETARSAGSARRRVAELESDCRILFGVSSTGRALTQPPRLGQALGELGS